VIFYLIKRILIILPTLFFISLVTFFLLDILAGNIVENELSKVDWQQSPRSENLMEREINIVLEKYHFDKPLFYFSITTKSSPDTLYRVFPKEKRLFIKHLTKSFSDKDVAFDFLQSMERINDQQLLYGIYQTKNLDELENLILKSDLKSKGELYEKFTELKSSGQNYERLIPKFLWNGQENRFHNWISGILHGDLGRSISDGLLIKHRVFPALRISGLLGGISIFVLFLVSVPLGIWLAVKSNSLGRWVPQILYTIDAMPLFWLAELFILFFASNFLFQLFPSFGVGTGESIQFSHFVLPVLSLVISAMPVIVIQTMAAVEKQFKKQYVLALRSKGLENKKILNKHILRNALNPLITLFTSFLPATIAGVMIVEYVYSIPGTGLLLLDAIAKYDYPMILIIIVLIGLVKMLANLLADIGYRLADPRISFI